MALRLPAVAEENKTLARVDKYGAARFAVTDIRHRYKAFGRGAPNLN